MTNDDGASLRALLRSLPVFDVDLPAVDFTTPPPDPLTLFTNWLSRGHIRAACATDVGRILAPVQSRG